MNLYNKHYKITVIKDLSSRFIYRNSYQILKLNKLSLNIGIKEFILKKNITSILLLEFITGNFPILTKARKNTIFLNIKKNSPNGVKINLHKQKIYNFFQKLGFYTFSNLKIKNNFFQIKKNNFFSFSIKEIDTFHELTFFYNFFKTIKCIDINLEINCFLKNNFELFFFLTSFKFPIYVKVT